ncbi:hypothetical protein C6503_19965 [Candidatus Poribacteria bacterium]|nr:MAG: hypothetical protein C6503_19965 [Candidatus Poribacteria bacterium]
MKINLFTTFVTFLFLLTLSPTNTLAQDYTKWELPEGAKSRLGKGVVTDIQISPDHTRLAIASSAGVWLYDVSTGNEIALFSREYKHKVEETIPRVVFSPDSRTLASSGYDDTIRIWNTETGKHRLTISMPVASAQLFKFLTDGKWSTTIIPADEVESFKFLPDHKTQSISIIFGGPLKSFKFLPDSKVLVIQNSSGTVWLWDITTREQFVTYSPKLPKPRLNKYKTWLRMDSLAAPDKWKLATDTFVDLTGGVTFAFAVGDKEGTISIQDGSTHQQIRTFTGSTDAELSLPIQDRVRRPGNARPILNELPTTWVKWVTELAFAPNGKTLVSRSEYRMVDPLNGGRSARQGPTEIWDVFTGKQLAALPPYESRWSDVDVKFSEDGKTLAIIGSGGCAIWDVPTPAEIAVFNGEVDAKFAGDGKIFAVIRNNNFEIWDIAKCSQIAALNTVPGRFALMPKRSAAQREGPTLAAISPDGTILAVIDKNGTVNVWKTLTGTQLRPFITGYTKMFTTLAFTHDGKTLASGDTSGKIQLWDLNTGSTLTPLTSSAGKPIDGLAFGTDDTTLTSESDGNIETWDVATGKQVDTYTIPGASGSSRIRTTISFKTTFVQYLSGVAALTPSGGKLAVFRDFQHGKRNEKLTVWDIASGEPLCTITDVSWQDIILAFASDGKTFATSGEKTTYLWNTYTGEQIVTLNIPAYSGAFAPDSKTLAIGEKNNNKSISLWNLARQERIATLKGHEYMIYQLAFSPDGTILASGDAGGVIRLWELPIGKHLTTFKSPAGYINKLAFAPDGKTLASTNGGSNFRSPVGTILLWNVPRK